jgi:hypothetical protein
MVDLRPCSECRRHVGIEERACPFCGAALAAAAPKAALLGRASRAAVFAGAALASSACGGKQTKPDTTNTQTASQDAGMTDQTWHTDPGDQTGTGDQTGPGDQTDDTPDRSNIPMPYGAPPARRRVV